MNVGPKTAVATWLALVAIGAALLSFGLSDDPNTNLRDAAIELALLREGPNQTFLDVCREFERRREQGVFVSPNQESTETWVGRLLGANQASPLLSSDFKVKGLLWCPYPSKSMAVKEALALVANPKTSSLTLWPHSAFLRSLGVAIREQLEAHDKKYGEEKHQEFFKFYRLAADIASGNNISRIEVTSDPALGTHILFECASTEAVFDPSDTKLVPKFPVQLIVSLEGGGTYCFQETDIPPAVGRLYGSGGFESSGLYTSYFGSRIKNSEMYSNKAAAKSGTRDVPQDRQVPNERGSTPTNEWFGFDFPALRSQIKDIGTLTVDEAYGIISSKNESTGEVAEFFGIKLPIRLFVLSTLIAIPLLTVIFLVGYRLHGVGALPETMQGLPKPLLIVAVVGAVCLIPATGLFLMTGRLQFVLPDIASFLPIASVCWMVCSAMALLLVHRLKMRKSSS